MKLGRLAPLALCAALACGPDPREAVRAEIKQLEEGRMERTAVEKARSESDAAEAQLAERRSEAESLARDLAEREALARRLTAEYAAETTRNEQLREAIRAGQERVRVASERGAELAAQIEKARSRAAWAREQAQVLAREIRPGDTEWATARRLRALAEFAQGLASEYPDDPTLRSLAGSAAAGPSDPVRGAELAGRIRDHMTEVYALEAAPAPAGSEPVQSAPAPPGSAPGSAQPPSTASAPASPPGTAGR